MITARLDKLPKDDGQGINPRQMFGVTEAAKVAHVSVSTIQRRVDERMLDYKVNPANGRKVIKGADLIQALRTGIITNC